MDAGEIEGLLERIDRAIGRIDGAMKQQQGAGGGSGELVAENARLRDAVSGAIARIDALISGSAK
jgi:hypothetical protein